MVDVANTSAMQQTLANSGVDFAAIGKSILFFGNYINDLLVKMVTAILKSVGTPYNNTQSLVIISIIYMIGLYYAVQIVKPMIKWGVIAGIIWLIVGFFKI